MWCSEDYHGLARVGGEGGDLSYVVMFTGVIPGVSAKIRWWSLVFVKVGAVSFMYSGIYITVYRLYSE